MIYKNIELGTKGRPVTQFKNVFGIASLGEVTNLERMRSNREFTATIRWDNGMETIVREVLFCTTAAVVEEVIA